MGTKADDPVLCEELKRLAVFAVSLLAPVDSAGAAAQRVVACAEATDDSDSDCVATGCGALRAVALKLRRSEKSRAAYHAGRNEEGSCGETDGCGDAALEERIAWIFGVEAVRSSVQDQAEPRRGSDSDDGASSATPALRVCDDVYRTFITAACDGSLCSLETFVFALRLFPRYLAGYSHSSVSELRCQFKVGVHDFPWYVLRECVALACNYMGEGTPCPTSVLTMHVQHALHFDVLEVTPMDYGSLVLQSTVGIDAVPMRAEVRHSLYRAFARAVLKMLSVPRLMTLPASEMAGFAFLVAVSEVAATVSGAVSVPQVLVEGGLPCMVSVWQDVSKTLTMCGN